MAAAKLTPEKQGWPNAAYCRWHQGERAPIRRVYIPPRIGGVLVCPVCDKPDTTTTEGTDPI